jgi:YidC/Oxa1 family membrane protein insertase
MWLQQKLNPAPTDPTQAMIFAWMPWIFMFMLGSFASGLVLYWIANNTITFIQQYAIMRSHGLQARPLRQHHLGLQAQARRGAKPGKPPAKK